MKWIKKVSKYQEYVQSLLSQYVSGDVSDDEVEVQLIFDVERDHYSVAQYWLARVKSCVSMRYAF